MVGLAADRRLAPEYFGITEAESFSDWDPPFPLDLSRVRPQDEAYWKEYRTTPKAFLPTNGRVISGHALRDAHGLRFAVLPARIRRRWRTRCGNSCSSG